MTDAQKDIADQVRELLREHFEASICVVLAETNDDEDERIVLWHGGYFNALGLLEVTRHRLITQIPPNDGY